MASMVVCDGCEAVIRGPVAALRVRKGSARELGAYPSLAYSGRVSARKMPLSGPKKTARLPACVGAEAVFGHRSGRFSASVFSCRVWPDRYTKTLYPPRTTCERLAIRGLAGAPCAFRNPGGRQGAMCRTTGQLASILPARVWLKWSTLIH